MVSTFDNYRAILHRVAAFFSTIEFDLRHIPICKCWHVLFLFTLGLQFLFYVWPTKWRMSHTDATIYPTKLYCIHSCFSLH